MSQDIRIEVNGGTDGLEIKDRSTDRLTGRALRVVHVAHAVAVAQQPENTLT